MSSIIKRLLKVEISTFAKLVMVMVKVLVMLLVMLLVMVSSSHVSFFP